ncbi:MAG: hypothetical protein Q7T01_04785 [bacterium]|nr:hypothetical protein [bacterium]
MARWYSTVVQQLAELWYIVLLFALSGCYLHLKSGPPPPSRANDFPIEVGGLAIAGAIVFWSGIKSQKFMIILLGLALLLG